MMQNRTRLSVPLYDSWGELLDVLLERTRHYGLVDWAVLKCCLVSFGLLLGATFSGFFKRLRPLLTILFLGAWLYTMWRLLFPGDEEYR